MNNIISTFKLKRDGECIGEVLVDKLVYEHIIEIKGCINCNKAGYPTLFIAGSYKGELHTYVYYRFYENKRVAGHVVDHIRGIDLGDGKKGDKKLDCRKTNLRLVSLRQNALNKVKKPNATSQFFGVSRSSRSTSIRPRWQCQLRSGVEGWQYNFIYDLEEHAGYHHDLLVKYHGLEEYKELNGIPEPEGFVMMGQYIEDLPQNIYKDKEGFYYKHRGIVSKDHYDSLPDVMKALKERKVSIKQLKLAELRKLTHIRNDDGIAIIPMRNLAKEIVEYALVDDDDYHDLNQYKWHMNDGYACSTIKGITTRMSKLLVPCDDNHVIDHDNHVRWDNRRKNLSIETKLQNAQNRSSVEGSASKYVGVHYDNRRDTWSARLKFNYRNECFCNVKDEEDAAQARERRVFVLNTLYKQKFTRNFPGASEDESWMDALFVELFHPTL